MKETNSVADIGLYAEGEVGGWETRRDELSPARILGRV